jgi:hypothetical protein
MKHIKVRGTFIPATGLVQITVLEQTHLGVAFGKHPVRHNSSKFEQSGFRLCSANGPGWYPDSNALYFKGNERGYDDYPVSIPLNMWSKAKQAIKAYNEWGRTQ